MPKDEVIEMSRAHMINSLALDVGCILDVHMFMRFHDLKEVHDFVGQLYQREHSEAPIEVVPRDLAVRFRTKGTL